MNKIKTYLKILPVLLIPMPVLAAQEENQVCKIRWGRVLSIEECRQTTAPDTKRKFCEIQWSVIGNMPNIKCFMRKSSV